MKTMKTTITIAMLCILLGGCGNSPKTENTPAPSESADETSVTLTEAQFKNSDIRIGEIHQQNISSLLKVNGKIEVPPQNMVSVSVPMGGYLKSPSCSPACISQKASPSP
jgi:cobalt-zinc-cadmium efflux system membrane fusion protein